MATFTITNSECCGKYPSSAVKKSIVNFSKFLVSKAYVKAIESILSPCCAPTLVAIEVSCNETNGYDFTFTLDSSATRFALVSLKGADNIPYLSQVGNTLVGVGIESNDNPQDGVLYLLDSATNTYTTIEFTVDLPTC